MNADAKHGEGQCHAGEAIADGGGGLADPQAPEVGFCQRTETLEHGFLAFRLTSNLMKSNYLTSKYPVLSKGQRVGSTTRISVPSPGAELATRLPPCA
jgi:hypothetical protein